MAKQRIRLTESQLNNIIRKCVNEAVNEEGNDLPFEYGNPDGVKSGSCTGEEQQKYWRSIGKHFDKVYPTRNNIDMFTLNTQNGKNPVYFHSKQEAKKWISEFIEDEETAKNLLDALNGLVRKGGGRYITRK